jgi:hypothetical protein
VMRMNEYSNNFPSKTPPAKCADHPGSRSL